MKPIHRYYAGLLVIVVGSIALIVGLIIHASIWFALVSLIIVGAGLTITAKAEEDIILSISKSSQRIKVLQNQLDAKFRSWGYSNTKNKDQGENK